MSCIGRWESPTNEREGLAFGDFNLVHGIRKESYAELLPKKISNKFTLAYVQLKVNLIIK